MTRLESFAALMLLTQILHSIEEITTRFDKKWTFIHKVGFKFMVPFLIIFNLFWVIVFFNKTIPNRELLLFIFIILMFGHSLIHLIWSILLKKYTPGLFTAIPEIIIFLIFYFGL